MNNYFETKEIIKLLDNFIEYKNKHIKYLNSFIGTIIKYEQLDSFIDHFEKKKTLTLILTISNVKKDWIQKDFFNIIEMLEGKEIKQLIAETSETRTKNSWTIFNPRNFKKTKEEEFTFESEITFTSNQSIDKILMSDLRKQDINEIFKMKFLNRIKENLEKDGILSKEVQSILLNQKKISKVNLENIESKYDKELDKHQALAFNASISNNDILIVKGPPGTGKSRLIIQLLKYYSFENKNQVIVASQTHAALDNIIENISVSSFSNNYTGIIWSKTSEGINKEFRDKNKMLTKNIRERLLKFSKKDSFLEKTLKTSHTGVRNINRFIPFKVKWFEDIVFTTLFSRGLENIKENNEKAFSNSILIIDEVSKLSIIDVLRFSMNAKKIILIGDNMQLPPIINNTITTYNFKKSLTEKELQIYKHLFEDSIFYKMYDETFKDNISLKNTYRNPDYILRLYNNFFYNSSISSKANKQIIEFKDKKSLFDYYSKVDLILIDNKNKETIKEDLHIDLSEIDKLKQHLEYINKNIINKNKINIMILFMYKKQKYLFINELKKEILKYKKNFSSFKYGTVDEMQGQESDIVYILTTMSKKRFINSNSFKFINILQSKQRINVALSRSKNKIILIGDIDYLKQLQIWDAINEQKTNNIWKDILIRFQKIIYEVKFHE